MRRLLTEARRRGFFAMLAMYVVGAWIVLQVAALVFPGWGIADSAIRHVWTGAMLLFPIAVLFSWRYDITPQGLRRTVISDDGAGVAGLTKGDHWFVSIMLALALGICVAVVREVVLTTEAEIAVVAPQIPDNSIAVLSFVNMSDDDSNEYFSDGISEELLNELSRVPNLHVAARTSAFYYKGKDETVQRMGAALGVRNILEGSVRKHGDLVRVTAQLIDAKDGYHLWSATFDRKLDDIFAVQTDIATAIVETLKVRLMSPGEGRLGRSITSSIEAYDLYLRAIAMQRLGPPGNLEESNKLLQQAIKLDPDFAVARAALAYGYLLQPFSQEKSVDEAAALAEPLLYEALRLEPEMEEAHASLGLLNALQDRYDESDAHYLHALEINPNYFQGHVNYGLSLIHQGRLKEASVEYLRAQSLDPLNANLNRNVGLQLILMGQLDDGLAFVHKAMDIDPDLRGAKSTIVWWQATYGRLVDAFLYGRKLLEVSPSDIEVISAMMRVYMYLDQYDAAEELMLSAQGIAPGNDQVRFMTEQFWFTNGDAEAYEKFADDEFQVVDLNVGDPLSAGEQRRVHHYGVALLMRRDYQQAADILYWSAGGDKGIAAMTYDSVNYLKYLAYAYQALDRKDEANELLARCLELIVAAKDNGWATPFLFVRLAEVYALQGETKKAIENIQIAYNKGWRDIGWLRHGLLLQGLRDNDEIIRIELQMHDDIEQMLASLGEEA